MYILNIIIPLISSILILLNGRRYGIEGVKYISIIGSIISIIIWIKTIWDKGGEYKIKIKEIINIEEIRDEYNIIINENNKIMTGVVIIISTLVILYSYWYMGEDPHIIRFISYLLLFSSTMLIYVNSNNIILTYIGWEGVGIMSYILINYWYNNINSNKSSMKAVYYNKIGDISILLIILSLIYDNTNTNIIQISNNLNNIINYSILFAILAKSAQFIFLPWLGDAMAGPTPVSALLHAATMVTAGVYLTIKLDEYYKLLISSSEYFYLIFIFMSIFTIIIAGFNSLCQNDIKKIIAYSTASQLAIMLLASTLNNPSLSLFHMTTHAFFKALLFLSSGLLIHNIYNEQDIRKYGSLSITYNNTINFNWSLLFFLFASLALISFPFFSGFYSKEFIINSSLLIPNINIHIFLFDFYINNYFIYFFLLLGALLTIFYSYRLIYYTYYHFPNHVLALKSHFIHLYSTPEAPIHLSVWDNKRLNYKLNTLETPFKYIFIFIFLSLASVYIGYILKDYFLSYTTYELHILYSENKIIKLFLLLPTYLISFIIFYLIYITYFLPQYPFNYKLYLLWSPYTRVINLLYILGNKRFFIDNFINFLTSSYYSTFYDYSKSFESYIFEFPLFFTRILSYFKPLTLPKINPPMGPIGGAGLNVPTAASFGPKIEVRGRDNNTLLLYIFISIFLLLFFLF